MPQIPQKKRGDLIDAPYLNAIAAAVNKTQMDERGAHLKRPGVAHGDRLPRSISPTGNARVRGVISASGVSPSIDYQAPGVRTLDAPASAPEGQQTIPLPETEGVQTYCAVITTDSTGTPTGTTYSWLTTVPADTLWDPVANTGGTLYRPICTMLPDAMWKSGLPQSTYALGHSGDLDLPSIPYNLPPDAGSSIGAAILGTRIGQSWPLRRIAAGSGISITEGDNAITIEAVGSIDPPTPVELANYNATSAPDNAGTIQAIHISAVLNSSAQKNEGFITQGDIIVPLANCTGGTSINYGALATVQFYSAISAPSITDGNLCIPLAEALEENQTISSVGTSINGIAGGVRGITPVAWNARPAIAEGMLCLPETPSLPNAINLVNADGSDNGSIAWDAMTENQSYLVAVSSSGFNLGDIQIFLKSRLSLTKDGRGNLTFGLSTVLS